MVPSSNTPYNPSDNSAPFMVLPEHVFGFVDLKTLADIHQYLRESEAEEDIILANWVKDNYLYEPIDQGGRTIRTTEGFQNLDKAYRRVRSLTNKAQDKWPFFDRSWKSMPSATVRNNARGEAAPGVSLLGMNCEPRASRVTNGFDTTKHGDSPAPQLQVPFGRKQPSRYCPRPSQQTPIPLPANSKKQAKPEDQSDSINQPTPLKELEAEQEHEEQSEANSPQELPTSTDIFSGSKIQAMPLSKPAPNDEPEMVRAVSEVSSSEPLDVITMSDQPELSIESEAEGLRDAGGGKVRGPNGRYLPKDKSSPASAKPRGKSGSARVKDVKNMKSLAPMRTTLTEARHMSRASTDDDVLVYVQSPSPSSQDNELENSLSAQAAPTLKADTPTSIIASGNDRPTDRAANSDPNNHTHFHNGTSNSSTPSRILAAEAEAVASNLDRLPPGLARGPNKRKSEPLSQQGPRKRGRPRKSEQIMCSDQKADKGTEENTQQSSSQDATEKQTPRMTTRRTTRHSAATISNAPKEGEKPAEEDVDMGGIDIPREDIRTPRQDITPRVDTKPKSSVDTSPRVDLMTGEDTNAGHEGPSANDLLAIGLSKTSSPVQRSEPRQPTVIVQPMNGTTDDTPANVPDPTHTPGHVEYFARVHTFNGGVIEIPIVAEKVDNGENELIRKYAEWMGQEGGMDISFKQFRSIFGFAKRG
ncbi:uncharacterized protein K460DRAFT_335547 [Cucurbitaria berberidis CBS 394.84]|uniref:Uncharacterized protein n=1 Tax=Cucurbitaria berberidis CBS 394.84 TaxID=1168544 RepID=A0A9P4L7X7_9PLEO|nr:uncharacterized protein K460DRAFT_335547 [Cucurbitaria berberidis CBS 394.84]KAF1844628.1 hypothetical protein K460DRAFT_335547 [Cucurbitaria berberidis CBS 394.84]